MNIMCCDDLVNVVINFYTENEILEERSIISNCVPAKRQSNRTGDKKLTKTVEDLLKIILDPNNKLPSSLSATCLGNHQSALST